MVKRKFVPFTNLALAFENLYPTPGLSYLREATQSPSVKTAF